MRVVSRFMYANRGAASEFFSSPSLAIHGESFPPERAMLFLDAASSYMLLDWGFRQWVRWRVPAIPGAAVEFFFSPSPAIRGGAFTPERAFALCALRALGLTLLSQHSAEQAIAHVLLLHHPPDKTRPRFGPRAIQRGREGANNRA